MPFMGIIELTYVQVRVSFSCGEIVGVVSNYETYDRVAGGILYYLAFYGDHAQLIFDNISRLSSLSLGKRYRRKGECKCQSL